MRFGEIPLDKAEGAILAHATVARGRPDARQTTQRIPKGTRLTRAHLDDLAAEGHQTLIVAQLDATDLHEDEAAARLAAALIPDPAGAGVSVTQAATGRVNVYATAAGIARIAVPAVEAFNAVDPMITLSTVRPFQRVAPRTMIATIKIISYGVPQIAVDEAAQAGAAALSVLPPIYRTASLIETRTTAAAPSDKGRRALKDRLDRLGVGLSDDRVVVPHRLPDLSHAIGQAEGEVIFVLTASATSDAHDVGPSALQKAGGTLTQFGMPVDPGNLLFLGGLGEKPVIGLPGCARSPALNGADWVLERVICGVPPTPEDFARMGVGGLLKEIPTRPKPRDEI
ncbi:molybdopterin-binding protein [Yoonia sp.]|uniref:molybdopterin-binding protein n=1 Tax=Yoonia sp. TaxID=2212373 RepID=UPI002FD900DB